MREIPHSPVALYEVANLFGALVAETILASVQCASAQTGRTYGRKRSDQSTAKTPCEEGAVHICEEGAVHIWKIARIGVWPCESRVRRHPRCASREWVLVQPRRLAGTSL